MKRLSLIKKISLGVAATAAITPIALMSTSCAITQFPATFCDFKSILDNLNYSKATSANQPFRTLLYGGKKVYDGNFVVFVGSNMFNESVKFFTGDDKGYRTQQQWYCTDFEAVDGRFNKSPFFFGIQKFVGEKKDTVKNFGIFNCIDFWDQKVYDKKGHQIFISKKTGQLTDLISPWEKWKPETITQTKLYNNSPEYVATPYEWDEKSVTEKEYIRNDASAVMFRALNQEGLLLYPTTDKRKVSFDCSDNNSSSRMVVFKNGKLKDITTLPASADAWQKFIEDTYPLEDKPEPEPPKPPEPTPPKPSK